MKRLLSIALGFAILPIQLSGVDATASEVTIRPHDPRAGVFFGNTVAISRDVLVVGAPFDRTFGPYSGAAYVFRRVEGTWHQEAKLLASDGRRYDQFGEYVALDGDWIVVSSRRPVSGDDNSPGAAYMFQRSGSFWIETQKFVGEVDRDRFGSAAAIANDILVLGAFDAVDGYGAAYIYRRDGLQWRLEQRLVGTDGGAFFGGTVAVSESTVVVGASADRAGGNKYSGAAYVFVRAGVAWHLQAVLTAADVVKGRRFGDALAVDGDLIAVGAPFDGEEFNQRGATYVFKRTGTSWNQQVKIVPGASNTADLVGRAVALRGGRLVIGAPTYNAPLTAPEPGSIYVYERGPTGWSFAERFFAVDPSPGDFFGVSVDLTDTAIAVGAIGNDVNGQDAGAAYVLEVPGQVTVRPTTWTEIKSTFRR